MDVSKVTLNESMKEAMRNPGLSREKKLKLRRELIYAYIRSRPTGALIGVSELIGAAQYPIFNSGWNQIQTMKRKGLIVQERVPGKKKSIWTIPGDVKTTHIPGFVKPETEEVKEEHEMKIPLPPESTVSNGPGWSGNLYSVSDMVHNAKQFAWEHNSDSLREFIATLR